MSDDNSRSDDNDAQEREADDRLELLRLQIKNTLRPTEFVTITAGAFVLIGVAISVYNGVRLDDSLQIVRAQEENTRKNLSEMQKQYQTLAERSKSTEFIQTKGTTAWLETGIQADWGGRDIAYTRGITPKFLVANVVLCDPSKIGSIAVCWQDRPAGYPLGTPSDFQGIAKSWCTYKDNFIQLNTPPDGHAPPGLVFVCSRSESARE